ncbi:MAG: hypothetical protein M1815_003202 [Lichina confinis]|nr:MAG: hypothetical protein M1815_003202 [Lichina confinis]
MDSPVIANILRQLSCRRAHGCTQASSSPSRRLLVSDIQRPQRRSFLGLGGPDGFRTQDAEWQQRSEFLPQFQKDRSEEYRRYPMVTADQLRRRKEPPKRVKMLVRDFIEDSLYNPHYGYFSKQVVIFSPGEPFQFYKMKNEPEFYQQLSQRYTAFEDALDAKSTNPTRQLWHTPTELFRPFYGEAIARYLVANYKLTLYPYHDLIIYEMGAGNGTLMLNILDYIREMDPEVYARTQFRVIEISAALVALQHRSLHQSASTRVHRDKISIVNKSIFNWDTYVSSPCFFLALEVIDNFAHDLVRYDPFTEEAYQGTVLIDAEGDFHMYHVPLVGDSVASRYIRLREGACDPGYPHPLGSSRLLRRLRASLPFAGNMTDPEYLPTRLMNFFEILNAYFPAHRLLVGDFNQLPNTIRGVNAPVVQTRFERRTVPVTTPLVQQGYFDILFPTDFQLMESIYRVLTGKFARVTSQEDFLRRWADVDHTRTANGENPMLSWYQNASVMTTL